MSIISDECQWKPTGVYVQCDGTPKKQPCAVIPSLLKPGLTVRKVYDSPSVMLMKDMLVWFSEVLKRHVGA